MMEGCQVAYLTGWWKCTIISSGLTIPFLSFCHAKKRYFSALFVGNNIVATMNTGLGFFSGE